MNLADMQAFVAVVESGSLAHAAVRLNITQPAITRRVQRLEEALGAALLDRDVKPARPTAEGAAAYAECMRVLNAADGLKDVFRAGALPHRTLRIGVSVGAADTIMPAVLPAPDGVGPITVQVGRAQTIEAGVAERRFDAALVFRDVARDPDAGERVARLPVKVVAARGLGLPKRLALKDLRGHRWVVCPEGCGYRRALEHGLYGAAQSLDVAAAVWGFHEQARLVAAGVGLGILPVRTLATTPHAAGIDEIAVEDFSAALDLWLVRPEAESVFRPRLEALLQAVASYLDAPWDAPLALPA